MGHLGGLKLCGMRRYSTEQLQVNSSHAQAPAPTIVTLLARESAHKQDLAPQERNHLSSRESRSFNIGTPLIWMLPRPKTPDHFWGLESGAEYA